MMLDMTKLFGVKDGEFFKIKTNGKELKNYNNGHFFIKNNVLMYNENGQEFVSTLMFYNINWNDFEVIKYEIPNRIEFTSFELSLLKMIHSTGLRYLTKDTHEVWLFEEKPTLMGMNGDMYWDVKDGNPMTICVDGKVLSKIISSLPKMTCVDLNEYTEDFEKIKAD